MIKKNPDKSGNQLRQIVIRMGNNIEDLLVSQFELISNVKKTGLKVSVVSLISSEWSGEQVYNRAMSFIQAAKRFFFNSVKIIVFLSFF